MTTAAVYVYCATCAAHVGVDVPMPIDRRVLVNAGMGLADVAGEAEVLHDIREHAELIGGAS